MSDEATRQGEAALPPSILDLPLEVLVHILEVGAFTPTELAPIRAVCVALRSAASHPTLYRVWAIDVAGPHFGRSAPKVVGMDQRLKAVPEWVATSLWGLELSGNPSPVVCVPGDVFPSLDRLEVRAAWDVPRYEALPPTLTRLFLSDARCLAPDMLAALTRVECLFLGCVDDIDTLPIASLPRLRRLSLKDCFGDLRTLLGALADSPLEAFDFALSSGDNAPYTAGWWEPLAVLPALRELGLATKPAMFEGGDAEAFASVIAGLDQVQSLTLSLMSNDVVLAVARHGLPPALRSVALVMATADGSAARAMAGALPVTLRALSWRYFTTDSFMVVKVEADEFAYLLQRCPDLAELSMPLALAAVDQVIDAAERAGRLVVHSPRLDRAAAARLAACGAVVVARVSIAVDWQTAAV